MLKHEAKLIDPDAEQIVAALTETTTGANKRCRARLLDDDPAKWRKFARDTATKPEGYAMFRGGRGGVPATQVLAAWWTDAIGRKHVVLRGRRIEHGEAKRLLQKEELEKRPPLWHAYPEYVCRRTVGGQSQIVCACGCGAVGTPESLGWMGETCGPCFDRKEEMGAAGLRANLPGVLYGDREPLGAVACSPDGNRVAAIEGENNVTVWDIPRRTRTLLQFTGRRVAGLTITPDSRYLLVIGIGLVANIGLFAAFDLTTDPPTRIEPTLEYDPAGWFIHALPDPELAVRVRIEVMNARSRIEVCHVPGGEEMRSADFGACSAFAVSPDATRLAALVRDEITILGTNDLSPIREIPVAAQNPFFSGLAFSHDNARVFCRNFSALRAYDTTTGKLLAEGGVDGKKGYPPSDGILALAVDPRGEFVFAGSSAGCVYAFAADTLARRAVFEWHLGNVVGLAVSADGSRVFSSGGDGCVKVWPIRDLMRGT